MSTKVKAFDRIRVYRTQRKALGGLIKWVEIEKGDSLGSELHINTTADTIYINGKRVWEAQ